MSFLDLNSVCMWIWILFLGFELSFFLFICILAFVCLDIYLGLDISIGPFGIRFKVIFLDVVFEY